MTKTEFMESATDFMASIYEGSYGFIDLESGFIFANKNYGEIVAHIAPGVDIHINLYQATEEEKENSK